MEGQGMPRWRKTTWAFASVMAIYNVLMGLWVAYVWSQISTEAIRKEVEAICARVTEDVRQVCLATTHTGAYYGLVALIILWFIGVVVLAVVWLIVHALASRPVIARPSGNQGGVIPGRSTPKHPTQIRHAHNVREAKAMLDEYVKQGYSVQSSSENTTLLMKSTWGTRFGHLLVALLTIWWTSGSATWSTLSLSTGRMR